MDLIYLMGGSGERMSSIDYPKQFYKINGMELFLYQLLKIDSLSNVDIIIIVAEEKYFEKIDRLICNKIKKQFKLVHAGITRQISVFNGLRRVTSKNVLIMESVRPFVTKNLYDTVINTKFDNVTPLSIINSTLCNKKDKLVKALNRNYFGEVQLPQKFNVKELIKCHTKALQNNLINFTDDCHLINSIDDKIKVRYINGIYQNIKITNDFDLLILKNVMELIYE